MNIVITDGYTLNPGDLDWQSITSLGNVTIYERSHVDDLYDRCKDADIILNNKTPINGELISKLDKLKLISVLATGYNIVDTIATKEKNIIVCNVPNYGTASVAQHTIALLLELSNNISAHRHSVEQGEWVTAIDWCYTKKPITELSGKTIGLVGFGNIGQQVGRIAAALGMHVVYNATADKHIPDYTFTNMATLFSESDVVSLHCPLTSTNAGFINRALLHTMKPSSFLINTARGQLINESDLAEALDQGVIAGAALDVLSVEPPSFNNPLLAAKNCVITPHNAWISKEARVRIMDVTVENIKAFIHGKPINRVA